jgi:hypothetical protein
MRTPASGDRALTEAFVPPVELVDDSQHVDLRVQAIAIGDDGRLRRWLPYRVEFEAVDGIRVHLLPQQVRDHRSSSRRCD